jgi:peptidoglycan/LPS O-acetylase OafA/YrhL
VYALTRYTVATGSEVSRPYVALFVLPFLLILILGAVTLDAGWVPSWLGARPMLRLGEWSFALYLVHKPIFLLTEQWNWWSQATGAFGDVVGFCGFCALVVGAAAMLYYGIERPLERALRRAPCHLVQLFVVASDPMSGDGHPAKRLRHRSGAGIGCRGMRTPVPTDAPGALDGGQAVSI